MENNTDKHFDQTDKDVDRLDQPETYRIQYKEHGKSYTYTETMYWKNDLFQELSTYQDVETFGDRFELVSVFLVVDSGPDVKVYDGEEKDFGQTRNAQHFSPGDEADAKDFQEGWDLSKNSDWKSTWDDYDPWDAYPQVSGEMWEPEHLGDR